MITDKQFGERVTALWQSQQRMAGPKKWHTGKRAGQIRVPAAILHFTKKDLEKWLWQEIGLQAEPCHYCCTPIDILSLTLDHVMPRSAGGEFTLDNLQVICPDCNHAKGNMTAAGFTALFDFTRTMLSGYDQGILLKRLREANAGSASRFFRDKDKKDQPQQARAPLPKPAEQPGLDWLGDF